MRTEYPSFTRQDAAYHMVQYLPYAVEIRDGEAWRNVAFFRQEGDARLFKSSTVAPNEYRVVLCAFEGDLYVESVI